MSWSEAVPASEPLRLRSFVPLTNGALDLSVVIGPYPLDEAKNTIVVPDQKKLKILRNIARYPAIYRLLTIPAKDFVKALQAKLAPMDNGIFIFGAFKVGEALARACREHGVKVLGFLDNASRKHGTTLQGSMVYAPSKKLLASHSVVVASGRYANEITRSLDHFDCSVFSMHEAQFHFSLPHQAELGFRRFFTTLFSNKCRFISAFLQLDDEESRLAFNALVQLRLNLTTMHLDDIKGPFVTEYLDPAFVRVPDIRHYVDVGAYNGDTLDRIEATFGTRVRSAYLFEVELQPHLEALKKYKDRPSIYNFNVGLADRMAKIPYSGQYSFDPADARSTHLQTSCMQLLPLDSLGLRGITLMKIDVEGAEEKVLAGAKMLLKSSEPKLAVCAYHRADDFWKLIAAVKKINPSYRVGMRHYSDILDDTTLYFY